MAGLVYILCAATSFTCAWLLWRAYQASGHSLLFWSASCFICLTCNNVMLVADRMVFVTDLSTARLVPALAAMVVLLYGLIWHGE